MAAGLASLAWSFCQSPAAPRERIGLFSSLPILWGEADGLGDLLSADRPAHLVKRVLDARATIKPLDTLDALEPQLRLLVIAQPRPLSPSENLALDNWVRGGGRLLLLADPLLTEPSARALGDPRRPQDIVLLSPILARWGLELTFDDLQPGGLHMRQFGGAVVPVNLPGAWRTRNADCQLEGVGVLVICAIGKGRVVALADAEVAAERDPDGSREGALAYLLEQAFVRP